MEDVKISQRNCHALFCSWVTALLGYTVIVCVVRSVQCNWLNLIWWTLKFLTCMQFLKLWRSGYDFLKFLTIFLAFKLHFEQNFFLDPPLRTYKVYKVRLTIVCIGNYWIKNPYFHNIHWMLQSIVNTVSHHNKQVVRRPHPTTACKSWFLFNDRIGNEKNSTSCSLRCKDGQ